MSNKFKDRIGPDFFFRHLLLFSNLLNS